MMQLYSLSRELKSDFTTDIYCLNTMCDQFIFQPTSCKYVSNVLLSFRNISELYFHSRHQILYFFKKVGNPLFAAYFLTTTNDSTFSSQIVSYGQTIIGTLQSGSRRWFHIPIMIPYHIYIQFWNSRKKISNFIFYAYFLKLSSAVKGQIELGCKRLDRARL